MLSQHKQSPWMGCIMWLYSIGGGLSGGRQWGLMDVGLYGWEEGGRCGEFLSDRWTGCGAEGGRLG